MRKIILLFIFMFVLINSVNASQIIFSEYEINKISNSVIDDCKSDLFLYLCHNSETIEMLGMKGDCIDYGFSLDDQNEIIKFGDLQKYYNGELVDLNMYKGKVGVLYSVHINNINKDQIIKYLSFLNNGVLINYEKNFPFIGCYANNSTIKTKELTVDETNQKFWDGKLIKEPRTFVQIGDIKISLYLFGFSISLISIGVTIFGISYFLRLKRKQIKQKTKNEVINKI